MANLLTRYGIKEVADVSFFAIKEDGTPDYPVLYLDTLKVTTLEQSAEQTDARGGKGNPKLITWDYGKELTLTIEDALFSSKSMAVMFGNGNVDVTNEQTYVARNKLFTTSTTVNSAEMTLALNDKKNVTCTKVEIWPANADSADDQVFVIDGASASTTLESGEYIFKYFYTPASSATIKITKDSFPGTYYVVGDTYARNEVTGEDEFFQLIIPKAKMQATNTITMQAEGDPSTFNMSLTILRPADGVMVKLVKYDV